ncbi:S8 family serine peptidase [Aliikangiella maris]|uniref:S8 family serine peptidase n=2 Tax=Aliikangiella maris TaxID=3162458 RepID=A0ABV3MU29_9GAMM
MTTSSKNKQWKLIPTALGVAGVLGAGTALAQAPVYQLDAENRIQDQYIVVLKQDAALTSGATAQQYVTSFANNVQRNLGVKVKRQYSKALLGAAVKADNAQLESLRNNPNVAYIEADTIVSVAGSQYNPPSWGLDRVDQANLPMDDTYNYPENAGEGVHVYILDTGIYANHPDFSGRVGNGADFIDNDNTPQDCQGHGTHVAGTAVGTSYGVAKKATVHAVRVLGCDGTGSWSGIIAGMDWVAENAQQPAVANMSLGGGTNSSVDQATANLVSAGVVTVVAAGNNRANACNYSPARVDSAITVGASTENDGRVNNSQWGSNYGSCVDIFAPGINIVSASHNSNGSRTMGGTSMASPHVAGAAAIHLQSNPNSSPSQTFQALLNGATSGVLSDLAGSPNKLLRVGEGDDPGCEPNCPTDEVLENGKPIADLSASKGQELFFSFSVPTEATDISVAISGGSGDADMYVLKGSKPTNDQYDCRPYKEGNEESCTLESGGEYWVRLHAYSAFSGVTLTGSYADNCEKDCTPPPPPPGQLKDGEAVQISGQADEKAYFTFVVPSGKTGSITTSGGNGDLDLYVKLGSEPTMDSYDCRPYKEGNSEACNLNQAGTYHIMVHAYSAYSGASIVGKLDSSSNTCQGIPAWNSSTSYSAGDEVIYQGKRYKANTNVFYFSPATNYGYWTLVSNCQ